MPLDNNISDLNRAARALDGAAQQAAGGLGRLGDALGGLGRGFNEKQLKAFGDFSDDVARLRTQSGLRTEAVRQRFGGRREDVADDFAARRDQVAARLALAEQAALEQREAAIRGVRSRGALREIDLAQRFQSRVEALTRDHRRRLSEINRAADRALIASAARLDAIGVAEALRQRRDAAAQEKNRFNDQLLEEQAALRLRIEAGRRADAQRISELQAAHLRESAERQRAAAQRLAELAAEENRRLEALRAQEARELAQISAKAEREIGLRAAAFEAELNQLAGHNGRLLDLQREGLDALAAQFSAWLAEQGRRAGGGGGDRPPRPQNTRPGDPDAPASYRAPGRNFGGLPERNRGYQPGTGSERRPDPSRSVTNPGMNFGSLGRRALGGGVGAMLPYLVGERGPELFVPRQGGQVIPNRALRLAGAQVSVTVNAGATDDPARLARLVRRELERVFEV